MKQERFRSTVEASIDAEFATIGITALYACHMQATHTPLKPKPGTACAVTVVSTDEIDTAKLASVIRDIEHELKSDGTAEYAPNYLHRHLRERGYPGLAICSCNDKFKRNEGRIRAKRNLLSHLMRTLRSSTTIDEPEVVYSMQMPRNIKHLANVGSTVVQEPNKAMHSLDDAVSVENECRYLRAKIVAHNLAVAYDELDDTASNVKQKLAAHENTIAAMNRTIAALRADAVDRNALIKEQGSTIDRFRATRDKLKETLGTEVHMRTRSAYIKGPFVDIGDPSGTTLPPVAGTETEKDVEMDGAHNK